MNKPRIYADFHNANWQSRLRLNCDGTKEELMKQGIELSNGLEVTLYQENEEIDGVVEFSDIENIWVAKVDWSLLMYKNLGKEKSLFEKVKNALKRNNQN